MSNASHESSVLQDLEWRNFIAQQTHEEELDKVLAGESVSLYCGFDPSAPSLHVGSLVPLMALAFFNRHGHKPIALVGGATGMIGDPSGKSEERVLLSEDIIQTNLDGIQSQIRTILSRSLSMHPETLPSASEQNKDRTVPIVNNFDWMGKWNFIDFLRDVGKHFRVNTMMAKDSVRARLEEREQGLSYTEFSYMLIQGFDFYHLFQEEGCKLQVGATDQWGNITAGTELIRRKEGKSAFGLTFPLLLSASGKKMGKTEKGAVWLSADRTSPYEFYQYWVQQDDVEVPKLLRLFTFLSKEEIDELVVTIDNGQNRGDVQRRLAYEVTHLVHGQEEADKAVRASQMLFGEEISGLTDNDLRSIFADVPSTEVSRASLQGEGTELIELLVTTGLQPSKGAARRLLKQGGVYLNNRRVESQDKRVTEADLASESMLVLRSGRKKYHVVSLSA